MGFEPLLTTIDWATQWEEMQKARGHKDDPSHWDARAKTYPTKHGNQSPYVTEFLAKASIKPSDTVLDMGCGTGALSTPLAKEGCKVIACDFSRGMLNVMEEEQKDLGITSVEVIQMSWEDDWAAHGVKPKSVDVAIASRSIATDNLKESLMKLSRTARRRACITLACGPSPKTDIELMKAAGLPIRLGADFIYAFNILVQMGINPEVSYIPSSREEVFSSFDEALETYCKIVTHAMQGIATPEQLEAVPENLKEWLKENLHETDKGWQLPEPRKVIWAFIAWDCSDL